MGSKDIENKDNKYSDLEKMAEKKLLTIEQNIKLQRIAKERSQIYVAMEIGISPSKLSKIENGGISFTVKDLILICKVLDVTPSDVMEEDLENASFAEMAHRRRLRNFDREEYKKVVRGNGRSINW